MAAATEPLVCPSCAETYPLDDRFCARCKMPLVYAGAQGIEAPVTPTHERARKIKRQYAEGDLVRVAGGRNQAEAEFIQGLLLEEGVPSMLRRSAGSTYPTTSPPARATCWFPPPEPRPRGTSSSRPTCSSPSPRACPVPRSRCWPRSSERSLSWRSSSGSGPAGSLATPPRRARCARQVPSVCAERASGNAFSSARGVAAGVQTASQAHARLRALLARQQVEHRPAEQRGVAPRGGEGGIAALAQPPARWPARTCGTWPEKHCAAPCSEPRPAHEPAKRAGGTAAGAGVVRRHVELRVQGLRRQHEHLARALDVGGAALQGRRARARGSRALRPSRPGSGARPARSARRATGR